MLFTVKLFINTAKSIVLVSSQLKVSSVLHVDALVVAMLMAA
jgi:hypothetical protein